MENNIIRLECISQRDYRPKRLKSLNSYRELTEEQITVWNEYRNFTEDVMDTLDFITQDDEDDERDWAFIHNGNPRKFWYQLSTIWHLSNIGMSYLVDVYAKTGIKITFAHDSSGLSITFDAEKLIDNLQHIKVERFGEFSAGLVSVTIDPPKNQ